MHLNAQNTGRQVVISHDQIVLVHLIGLIVDDQLLRVTADADVVLIVPIGFLLILMLIELTLIFLGCSRLAQQAYQLTEYFLVITSNIGTQINTGEVILMNVFLKWRFAEQMSKCLFQQFDAGFIRRQDAKITALRVDQCARIDDHTNVVVLTFLFV